MSRTVTVAAVQMQCSPDPAESLARAERAIRKAAAEGAQIILLPELFERQYYCQERRYDYYAFAQKTEENPAVRRCMELAEELQVVLPVSFYERDGNRLFNSAAIIDGIPRPCSGRGRCSRPAADPRPGTGTGAAGLPPP